MKIDIIFSLPKTVLKKAKEALPRDLKEHICTAGGGAREVRHQESAGHAASGQAPSWGMTSDSRQLEHRTLPLHSSCNKCNETIIPVRPVLLSSVGVCVCACMCVVHVCMSVYCTLVVCCGTALGW